MSSHRVGVGMLGYGFMARAHLAGLQAIDEARIVAIGGPRPERAQAVAQEFEIPSVHASSEELLANPDVEAVVVASPDDAHHPQVLAAAAARKHVFVEKPIALNASQAREMASAVRAAGVRSGVGFTLRWNPLVQRLGGMIERGELGDVISVHAQRFNSRLLGDLPTMQWRYDVDRTGSGVLGDLGGHMLDLAQYLVGPIVSVAADLRTTTPAARDPRSGEIVPLRLDDDALLLLQFGSGAHGTIATSRVGMVDSNLPLGRSSFQVNGTKASFLTDGILQASVFRLGQVAESLDPGLPLEDADHAGILAFFGERMMRAFITSIREERDVAPTITDGLRTQEVIDAALTAARTRAWVDVPQTEI